MARGRKRATSREHVTEEVVLVTLDDGSARNEVRWRCRYCNGEDDGGLRKTVTFPASRFDVHLTVQCTKCPEEVKKLILDRSLSRALTGKAPPTGSSYTALLKAPEAEAVQAVDTGNVVFPSSFAATAVGLEPNSASLVLKDAGANGAHPPSIVTDTPEEGHANPSPDSVRSDAGGTAKRPQPAGSLAKRTVSQQVAKRRKSSSGIPVQNQSPGDQAPPGPLATTVMEAVVRFFCTSGLPLSVAAGAPFANFCRTLNRTLASALEKDVGRLYNVWLPHLYKAVEAEVGQKVVGGNGNYRTVGFEPFVSGEHLYLNTFWLAKDAFVFKGCMDLGTDRRDDTTVARLVSSQLCGEVDFGNSLVGVVGDLGMYHPAVMPAFRAKRQKLFFIRCARKSLASMLRVIIELPEIAAVVKDAVHAAKFAQVYLQNENAGIGTVMADWAMSIMSEEYLKLEVGAIVGMLEQSVAKHSAMRSILEKTDLGEWGSVRPSTVGAALGLETWVRGDAVAKVKRILDLLGPFVRSSKYLDAHGCRISWILPLFSALLEDSRRWASESCGAGRSFSAETGQALLDVLSKAWTLDLMNVVHTFAWLMDPHTTPLPEDLPDGSRDAVRAVLAQLTAGNAGDVAQGMDDLEGVLLRDGEWGKVISDCQASLNSSGVSNSSTVAGSGSEAEQGIVNALACGGSPVACPADTGAAPSSSGVSTAGVPSTTVSTQHTLHRMSVTLCMTDEVLRKMSVATDGARKWRAYGRQFSVLMRCAARALSLVPIAGTVGKSCEAAVAASVGDEKLKQAICIFLNGREGVCGPGVAGMARDFVSDTLHFTKS